MTQELDLKVLRKVAEAATPGPWVPVPAKRDSGGYEPFYAVKVEGRLLPITYARQDWEGFGNGSTKFNATHIATFDPPTVLALLSRLEQAESAVSRVEKLLADSEEIEAMMPDQYDRIWISSVRRALNGDGRG